VLTGDGTAAYWVKLIRASREERVAHLVEVLRAARWSALPPDRGFANTRRGPPGTLRRNGYEGER
jgi:hypothetical protein